MILDTVTLKWQYCNDTLSSCTMYAMFWVISPCYIFPTVISLMMYTILYTTGPWYDRTQLYYINSVVPGRSEYNFEKVVFSLVSQIDIFTCSYHNALRWIPVASFTKEVNQRLAKRPLRTNGHLANRWLTSLVKEASGDLTYEKSTLVQVMAWCCQATNSYQS